MGLLLGRYDKTSPDACGNSLIVITGTEPGVGLPIDHIVGQQQVVIRAVHTNDRSRHLSATVLGDGTVALILTAAQIAAALSSQQVAA